MSKMRTVTTINNSSVTSHENNLDALLDDLQSSIARGGGGHHHDSGTWSSSSMSLRERLNGGVTPPIPSGGAYNSQLTGYREVRTTVSDGTPGGTKTEYQIEYLTPANTATHVQEIVASPNTGSALVSHGSGDYGGLNSPFKEVSSYKYSTKTSGTGGTDLSLRQNISELDSLLDDLNTPNMNVGGVQSITNASPRVSRAVERHYTREEERRLGGTRSRSDSPGGVKRELVFTGGGGGRKGGEDSYHRFAPSSTPPPPPLHQHQHTTLIERQSPSDDVSRSGYNIQNSRVVPGAKQEFYRYERTTTTRTTGPTEVFRADGSMDEGLNTSSTSPSPHRHLTSSDPPPHRHLTSSERVEKLEKSTTGGGSHSFSDLRDQSPNRSGSSRRGGEPTTPPPHRSPSPVSFNQPPEPKMHQAPPPSPPLTSRRTLASSYVHSSSTTSSSYRTDTGGRSGRFPTDKDPDPGSMNPLLPRPFPIEDQPSHSPQTQQPPKKLDELMASFSDTEISQNYQSRHDSSIRNNIVSKNVRVAQSPEKLVETPKPKERREESKNLTGPPVYYPPGELFIKKEESMTQKQLEGGKYKEKEKYEYKAKSKSKSSESSGKAVVPVCIPLCCGMPCVIM